jgi:hypothetical protein
MPTSFGGCFARAIDRSFVTSTDRLPRVGSPQTGRRHADMDVVLAPIDSSRAAGMDRTTEVIHGPHVSKTSQRALAGLTLCGCAMNFFRQPSALAV